MELSPYILAIIAAWLVAQGAKYLIITVKQRSFKNLRQLYLSGNMPSAHSASVVALCVLVGLKDGIGSGLFGLAALFAGVVMYDAVMVRRSSGEQGIALQNLIKEQKSAIPLPRAAKGHTPVEVLVGALLGGVIGVVVFLATK
ncbi:divergent PAP2 family protein [Streptomyces caniscabiei]|uniref:divergent PAP2 family protein n=1 Tax=Streptomyces caniscabiei TaxID=2746961 RepID=UPI0029B3F2EF|nr:divergent PAP2 family protein [Streptomyces caniscabiei]MDX2776269.1 divergent PAP2 family protein [Streptomyces caniscabiei]